ncbi:MAG: phosphoribosylformylglycinamidine synthase subunit PurS [Candidatus Micrarchaeaceae archaeon]|jgi:phosphoribosylformylglycinamidine (FGAM) synthase PurS component|nr:phosphoribosylformylglycinamidine synthase subunit PurS [Candidatus Micrarchaeota archaeon]
MEVAVTRKPTCHDPEGWAITELGTRLGYTHISSVRVGKLVRMDVNSESLEEATRSVAALCDDMYYYTSVNSVDIREAPGANGKPHEIPVLRDLPACFVDAVINYKPGIPNPDNQPVLEAARAGNYSVSNVSVSKMLRICVADSPPGGTPLGYVKKFDRECKLHNELLHEDLELRVA